RNQEKLTDLVLAHDAGKFSVHKIVVCPQSKVFYKACTGGFEVSIAINLVTFFYRMDYNDDLPDGTNLSPLQLHVRMFALADQYDIPDLATVAAEKYSSECSASWVPADFLASIPDIYESTPACSRKLRDLACLSIRRHLPRLLEDESIAGLYRDTLVNNPDFARDLLASYVDNPLCGSCATCGPDQPMEALQTRCKKCRKGNSSYCLYV
ncbi:hypothetical protein DM02DRAFT_530236, partial [Periconia macrospinosa]